MMTMTPAGIRTLLTPSVIENSVAC